MTSRCPPRPGLMVRARHLCRSCFRTPCGFPFLLTRCSWGTTFPCPASALAAATGAPRRLKASFGRARSPPREGPGGGTSPKDPVVVEVEGLVEVSAGPVRRQREQETHQQRRCRRRSQDGAVQSARLGAGRVRDRSDRPFWRLVGGRKKGGWADAGGGRAGWEG